MPYRYSSDQTNDWLRKTMAKLNISSLSELSKITNIDPGSLSRYFNQERRPSIDVIDPLCRALAVSPEELLKILGAKEFE